ncbi:MAG: malonyl-CoA synthase [Burkholderiaceae bacterium]|jgi:malonyl-CoA/methylmalonyl-CoA synthetase|nr:malonyl-CoA synthase [Burkholderiaceae bacterium]
MKAQEKTTVTLDLNANLYAALRAAFPADLDGIAVETDEGLFYTWRDLERASAMMAHLFAALGVPPGARILAQVDKSVEAMMLYLAALRGGYVFVPLNNAYQRAELEYFIADAEPAVVVCTRANAGWIEPMVGAVSASTGWPAPHLFTLDADRSGSLLEQAAQCSDEHAVVMRTADDWASIIYTSGTTGRSKGAMLTHGNLLDNARVLKDYWGWRSPEQGGDVLIHALPIFHVHGLFVAIHGALLNGSKMIWLARFDPRTVIARMPEATVFMGVPTLYVRMLAESTLERAATGTMRLFISGSAPLLLETFETWRERTGHTILERYGMSETIMLSSNPYDRAQGERRGGTVGFALPGVQLRVRDKQGRDCAVGEIGDIQVCGPSVFAGYWRMPEKTREAFTADGYFKTGDVGQIDALGYLTIVGRSKDLIISGGLNVYPAEVEGDINALDGVAESAVVGVPHADFGEVGVAIVVAQRGVALDGEAILSTLRQRLAHFKVPKRCFIVTELPRNTMGKVQKALLREQHKDLFWSL